MNKTDILMLIVYGIIVSLAIAQVVDLVNPKEVACQITIKDFNGNKHMYIGKGKVL